MARGNIKAEIKKLGYKIVYVPDKLIGEHIACYKVRYKGKIISTRPAAWLKIPINQIWISDKYKKFEKGILHHELVEIDYKRKGYTAKEAHRRAKLEDERQGFRLGEGS